jgi:hypothetical protein
VIWFETVRSHEGGERDDLVDILLTCGHWYGPLHECSSSFDFPDDAYECDEGCGLRQMDLRLQVAITTQWDEEAA